MNSKTRHFPLMIAAGVTLIFFLMNAMFVGKSDDYVSNVMLFIITIASVIGVPPKKRNVNAMTVMP
jgi:hypothetical protein